MKTILPCLLTALFVSTGCLPFAVREAEKAPASQYRSAAPAPPVTVESITDKNATEKAQELRAELDREAAREPGGR